MIIVLTSPWHSFFCYDVFELSWVIGAVFVEYVNDLQNVRQSAITKILWKCRLEYLYCAVEPDLTI